MVGMLQSAVLDAQLQMSDSLDEQDSHDARQAETPTTTPNAVSRRSSIILSPTSSQSRYDCFSIASSDSICPAPNMPAVLDLLFSNDRSVQAVAAGTLKSLSQDPNYCTAISPSVTNLESILCTLKNLALHDLGSHEAIAAAGGIKIAVNLLSASSPSHTQAEAAGLLLALADTPAHLTTTAAAGAIPLLLQLLCASTTLQAVVLPLLTVMAGHSAARIAMVVSGGAPALLGLLNSTSSMAMCSGSVASSAEITKTQELVATAISELALERASHADIISWGGVQLLVELMTECDYTAGAPVQAAAATALGRLATDAESHAAIAAAGGVSALLHLLHSEHEDLQAAACRALSRLAADPDNRKAIANARGVAEVSALLAFPHELVQFRAIQTLQNLAVDSEIGHSIASVPTLQQLVGFLGSHSTSGTDGHSDNGSSSRVLAVAAAGCLSNLAYNGKGCAGIAAAGGIEKLVQCLHSGDDELLAAAAGALAKLAWEVQHCESIIAAGAIKPLVSLLRHDNNRVLDAAAVVLENLTYDSPDIRLAVADEEEAIPLLVQLLETGTEYVQKHAAAVLHNLAIQRNNRRPIAAAGAVHPLAKLMHSDNTDLQSAAGSAIGKLVMEPVARMALIKSSAAATTATAAGTAS